MMQPTILVVDDEIDVHEMFAINFHKQIRQGKYHFLYAQDGQEALDIIETESPNIVFTDLNMPRMDGLTLVKHLRKHYFDGHIIVISAYGDLDRQHEVMRQGAFEFLGKPVEMEHLEISLRRALASQLQIRHLEHQNRELGHIIRALKKQVAELQQQLAAL